MDVPEKTALVVSGGWTLIPGGLVQISVSGDGSEVWGVNSDDEIFYRAVDTTSSATVAGGKWELMSGRMTQVDVASIGSCCEGQNKTYRKANPKLCSNSDAYWKSHPKLF